MINSPEVVAGVTTHTRRGAVRHMFRYEVDYVLIDLDSSTDQTRLFSRNRFNLVSVHDRDHGGPLKSGQGANWAREVFSQNGLVDPSIRILLLTQPRMWGYVFNPVSFWLAFSEDSLVAVIAEVSTPFGDRHSYLCHQAKFAPITKDTKIRKPKYLHVSPFQRVEGSYDFRFDIQVDHINIEIVYRNGLEGVAATLSGSRAPMTDAALLRASFRRPLGAMRTTALIHWQALRLKLKGAHYRTRPTPPSSEVS